MSSHAKARFGIRLAKEPDAARLPAIERDAGALFRDIGMDAVADDEVPTSEEFRPHITAGRVWVAVDDSDTPVAYLLGGVVDGRAHIEQVSVLPACSRRGIGRALIEHAIAAAATAGFTAVTLTTFTDVPWNGPYYLRLGFRYLDPDEVGPELKHIREQEALKGLDAWPRASMIKTV